MPTPHNPVIEIAHAATGTIVVCDTLAYCLAKAADTLRSQEKNIRAALLAGKGYTINSGSLKGFTIQPAPIGAVVC